MSGAPVERETRHPPPDTFGFARRFMNPEDLTRLDAAEAQLESAVQTLIELVGAENAACRIRQSSQATEALFRPPANRPKGPSRRQTMIRLLIAATGGTTPIGMSVEKANQAIVTCVHSMQGHWPRPPGPSAVLRAVQAERLAMQRGAPWILEPTAKVLALAESVPASRTGQQLAQIALASLDWTESEKKSFAVLLAPLC